jgi:N-acetyl-anhydromuramyl-L-alanine amidase AmpD
VKSDEWDLEYLREVVHQLVIHYDGCGTARRCFKVLHDERALSCHFIIDLDGTIYQVRTFLYQVESNRHPLQGNPYQT